MRAIDAGRLQKQFDEKSTNPNYRVNMHNIKSIISNAPTVEAIPKADYENRLKADMLTMLYKLRSEIINMPKYFPYADHTRWFIDGDVFGLIDKKINALKENDNGLNEKTSD